MTGPSTPGQEGPSYGPPSLPEGWIAQWDGMSRKYYFVQLSTGASQWETPIHPAPTGPTPQATPQEGIEHPYGVPQQQQEQQRELDVITNQDGSQSIRHPDGSLEPYSGERGISSFVVNQYMHKQNGGHGQNQSGLAGMASQFLGGGGKTHQGSAQSSGAAGIVGALAGSLLGGNKPNPQQQTNYSGSPNPQQHQSGIMGSLGGMFGGHQGGSQGNNYGYSQGGSTPQGGYSGAPPPAAYQPNNAAQNNYSQPSVNQPFSHSQNPQPQSYSQQYNGQQPPYGAPQQQYGTTPQQSPYGGSQAPYGAGSPPQQYGGQGYPQGNGQPGYGGPPPGMENQQFGGPGAPYQGAQPPIPHGSHPHHGHHNHHGHHGSGSGGPPPGYGQQGSRW